MRIYTRKGDGGATGLLYGGRVPKTAPRIELNGAVDEAQAALGLARAEAERGSELDQLLVRLERELYVLMAEVATLPVNRRKLLPGTTLVTSEMVADLEATIDDLIGRTTMPEEFVVPGQNRRSALLDLARTVIRRAERLVATAADGPSEVGAYLNRLSDLVWAMARWQEGDDHIPSHLGGPRRRRHRPGADVSPARRTQATGGGRSVAAGVPGGPEAARSVLATPTAKRSVPAKRRAPGPGAAPGETAIPGRTPPAKTGPVERAPAKKTAPTKKTAPAKKTAPTKKSNSAKKTAPAKKSNSVKKTAPAKKTAPTKQAAPRTTTRPVTGAGGSSTRKRGSSR